MSQQTMGNGYRRAIVVHQNKCVGVASKMSSLNHRRSKDLARVLSAMFFFEFPQLPILLDVEKIRCQACSRRANGCIPERIPDELSRSFPSSGQEFRVHQNTSFLVQKLATSKPLTTRLVKHLAASPVKP